MHDAVPVEEADAPSHLIKVCPSRRIIGQVRSQVLLTVELKYFVT